jgi:SAM-dependent methyltransferase
MTDIFFELHQNLPREGPGDNESTGKALSLLTDLPHPSLILDIGCGPGIQTLELARLTEGRIVAIDTHQPFLHDLKGRTSQAGVATRVTPMNMSMFALAFHDEIFDAIWSEGAAYIMGFDRALREWRRFLKPAGYLVISEVSWLRSNPPAEVKAFWETAYPAISFPEAILSLVRATGYRDVGHFTLPPSAWFNDYYLPLEARIGSLRERYRGNQEATGQLDEAEDEINFYRKYAEWYGYVFYIMQAS